MDNSKTLETVPSIEASYSDQKTFGVVAGRSHVEMAPKYGGDFAPGDIIRLEIPAQAYLDPNEFYIHFRTGIIAGAPNAGLNHGIATYTEENKIPYLPENAPVDLTVQFQPGIQCIFNRVRLLAGSVVLEDIQDYNVLYRMMLEATTSKQWRETDGFHNEGVYDPEDDYQMRTNYNWHSDFTVNGAPNQGHFYSIRPLLGLFSAGKYIPLKYMGQLTLELYLEQPGDCLWSSTVVPPGTFAGNDILDTVARQYWPLIFPPTSTPQLSSAYPSREMIVTRGAATIPDPATGVVTASVSPRTLPIADESLMKVAYPNATYRVHDVRMHLSFVHPIESYDQSMMRQIEQGGISIYHATWSTHTRQIPGPDRTTLSFQERALSVKGAFAVMRNSPDIRAIDTDLYFPANGIQSYQWKIGSEYIPAQPVSCVNGGSRALAELRKGLGIYDNQQMLNKITEDSFLPVDHPHQLDTFDRREHKRMTSLPCNFIMALDLEKSPGQASGFDSAASSVDIELNLVLKDHKSLVGQTVDTTGQDAVQTLQRFKGASSFSKFQPCKRLVRMPYWDRYSMINASLSGFSFERTTGSAAITNSTHSKGLYNNYVDVFATSRLHDGHKTGGMFDKQLTYTLAASAGRTVAAGNGGPDDKSYPTANPFYSVADNSNGVYARVYFFAHIDQILRFTAVGRMEVIR